MGERKKTQDSFLIGFHTNRALDVVKAWAPAQRPVPKERLVLSKVNANSVKTVFPKNLNQSYVRNKLEGGSDFFCLGSNSSGNKIGLVQSLLRSSNLTSTEMKSKWKCPPKQNGFRSNFEAFQDNLFQLNLLHSIFSFFLQT